MTELGAVGAYALKTNGRVSPREVDVSGRLRFTWRLRSASAAQVDSHRVTLATETGDVWSSGWILGDETALTAPPDILRPVCDYRWRLETRSSQGSVEVSEANFTTGVHTFTAQWIRRNPSPWFADDGTLVDPRGPVDIGRSWRTMYSQPPLQLRTRFTLGSAVKRARLYATAEGVYRTHLNGQRVGRDELTPGWTRYESRLDYQGYDVTDLIDAGSNVWAAEVGDGWWSGYIGYHTRKQAEQYGSTNGFLAELHIELVTGEVVVQRTGPDWEEKFGARVMADLLMGEYHDYTVETPGWMTGEGPEGWRPVVVGAGSSQLRSQMGEPVRVVRQVAPTSISRSRDLALIDFGQNLVGRLRVVIEGVARGDVIRIRHGEMLDGDNLYTENLRSAEATDVVVAGTTSIDFEPAFTIHGFRYASIEGLSPDARLVEVEAKVLSSDLEEFEAVETSSPMVNQLLSNIRWSQRGNFVGIPTDCNQRDERLGWTADAQVFTPTAALGSDISAFMSSWLYDLAAAQGEDGVVPDVVPTPPTSTNFSQAAPAWGDAATIIPWHLYRTYGDLELLRQHFPMMRRWVDYVASRNPDGRWTAAVGNNYGDWLSVNADTPKPVVALAYRIRSTDLVADAADALEETALAAEYRALAEHLRHLFESTYVSAQGEVLGDTQTGYLFALAWRLVPDARRAQLGHRLVERILANDSLLTTGFLGVNLLCPTLTELGYEDLAVQLLLEERFPSWGYSIAQGATTIWERWDGWTASGGFHTPAMNSFNHYSLGSVGEWIYRHLAGIDQHPESIAYRRLVFKPILTPRLDHVKASFESPRGLIQAEWVRDDSHYRVTLVVPPGTTAEVHLGGSVRVVGAGIHEFDSAVAINHGIEAEMAVEKQ